MTTVQLQSSERWYNTTPNTDAHWWQTCIIYQIYPRSFQDTNGDGIGDLKGIQQRLPYLKDLGIDAIWISPFFKSPMADFGYDISDYCDIDPTFGTMQDFDNLLAAAHENGIRLLIDFVPNHTSNQHEWFIESRSSKYNPKRDWYLWRDPKPDGSPPTNLTGFFGGSAWTYDDTTEQYYLHMFLEEQPDLNWRNPDIVEAMHDVMHFWLQKGVDGLRLDAITVLIKADPLTDLPEDALVATGADLLTRLKEIHNQPELHDVLRGFRQVLNEYDSDPVMIGETGAAHFEELMGFYGDNLDEIHLPMNLNTLTMPWDAKTIQQSITEYYEALREGATPSLVFGNHDQSRLATRYGIANHRAANTILLTLWGVPTMYYGDELGMVDGKILPEQRQDPFVGENDNVGFGRDPERTPMQWDNTPNAGFTSSEATPWLPINTTFQSNVAEQDNDLTSTLNFIKRVLQLRQDYAALQYGGIRFVNTNANILAYERKHEDITLLILVNFGDEQYTLDNSKLAEDATLLLSSTMTREAFDGILHPHESLILQLA